MVRTRSLVPCLLAAANRCVVLPFTFHNLLLDMHFATGCLPKQMKHKRLSFTTFSLESVSVLVLKSLDLCTALAKCTLHLSSRGFPTIRWSSVRLCSFSGSRSCVTRRPSHVIIDARVSVRGTSLQDSDFSVDRTA